MFNRIPFLLKMNSCLGKTGLILNTIDLRRHKSKRQTSSPIRVKGETILPVPNLQSQIKVKKGINYPF